MTDILKIGIVGARARDTEIDKELIRKILKHRILKGDKLYIISGGCPKGADRFAEELAIEFGLPVSIHYPDKSKMKDNSRYEYARVCYERNSLIANECDLLIALPAYNHLGPIGGTADTIRKTEILQKPVILL